MNNDIQGNKTMRKFRLALTILATVLMLSSCGGGSSTGTSEGGGAFEPPGNLDPSERIKFQVFRTVLPANVNNVPPFVGSPFITEIKVTILEADGSVVPNGSVVNFNVAPVAVGLLTTPDDPETEDINEFTDVRLESGFSETNSGQIAIFFLAQDRTGTATVRASYDDPETGRTISNSVQIRVVNPAGTGLPQDISIVRSDETLYTQGSGGPTSTSFQIVVEDGGGTVVPDPDGFNNLQVELVGQDLGATLSGAGASGQTIQLATVNGVAAASLRSGNQPGTVTVQVTADAGDNNVSNGIGTPVTQQFAVVIADGSLFALTLTTPNTGAIRINRVDPSVEVPDGTTIPPDPDGTYSLTVSVIANDRGGNPVVPGTRIGFGLIDAPVAGFPASGSGSFVLSGGDGDPEEGRFDFFAPSGSFTTAGGGAGPGDTLVLFGDQAPPGNADLESARTVDTVIDDSNLTVSRRFNLNDTTGQSVDNGPVIPYAIGRASHGNIQASAVTDANGVATVTMNYPVSRLGQIAIIYAQGEGEVNAQGHVETVADVAEIVFPGVAPAQFTALPSILPPNTTTDVRLCIADALGSPLPGAFIRFQVQDNQGATVTIDGVEGSGFVQPATGADGCTIATVTSSGQSPSSTNVIIIFSVGGLQAQVDILPPGNAALFAIPNAFVGNGFKDILLRLVDAGGNPIPGVQIGVECTGSESGQATVVDAPGVTNQNGETTSTVNASVDNVGEGGTASCTFFTVPRNANSEEAVVTFRGSDLCDFSPQPAECPTN